MTLLAIYYRRHFDDLYAFADTRLTSAGAILSEHQPKLFKVHLSVFDQDDVTLPPTHQSSIGVGFTGSALSAFATINTLQSCTAELSSIDGKPPTLKEIADFTLVLLESHIKQIGSITEKNALAELMVFGKTIRDLSYDAYLIKPKIEGTGLQMNIEKLDLYSNQVFATGSGSKMYLQEIEDQRRQRGLVHPLNILREMIHEEKLRDVGGYLQAAIARKENLALPFRVEELDEKYNLVDFSYLGLRKNVIGKIGNCDCGITLDMTVSDESSPRDMFLL